MELKNKLKELRSLSGLSQKQVAEYLNMSKTGYANWEQGLAEPNIENIKKLCKLFKVTADDLLGTNT